ncbi:MAG TPA: ABC-F family ATP-binding cassette domain-containing protein, partial [bacterium]|nr:ABC-F family ATP-binding cassette domain-containing protein [bacterium]
MTILIGVQNLAKSYGSRSLFRGLSFSLAEGERVGLLGPNGAGKSSLLRLLAGLSRPDGGEISSRRGLRVGFLEQVPRFAANATVESTLQSGADHAEDWDFHASLQEWLSRLELDGSRGVGPETPLAELSGGWKKRVALARELAKRPDLLLLDEPTNHLDVESIAWLEKLLAKAPFACLCVTHDRLFLQRFANRILELNSAFPEGALSVAGTYADYLEEKERLLAAQERREFVLQNTLRRETEWLRRGPKARGTKQQARIQRAGQIAEELDDLSQRRQVREVGIDFAAEEARPKKLIEAKAISKDLGGRRLFSKLDLLITPQSRLGLLGANGCGKSTLLKVLLGGLKPDSGEVFQADNLQVAYFEQNRESLDPDLTLARSLCPSGDHVDYRGNPVHIRGYLDRFLFNAAQVEMPVGRLSGGEQSRLLLAKLMLKPANVLVLDEPTNDLDIATLDLLRDSLREFPGAVLLVTHDRFFLNEVADRILAFGPEESSAAGELVAFASLEQWENWQEGLTEKKIPEAKPERSSAPAPAK